MTPQAPALPGEMIGAKYRVERILGQGGMGVVVSARHMDLDERVAIKFLLGDCTGPAGDRFLREARAAVKVKGEHVCRVLDFGRLDTGEPFIVMEYLEGTDLAKKIANEGAQATHVAVSWVIEACDALSDSHALGIVHRDIKPANIFLSTRADGSTVAKVLDFGISKLPSQAQLTGTQAPMGSPAYMSPEQMLSAHDVDARTDIWSLGVTLYELLSGRPPFVAESMVQLTVLVREKDAPKIAGVPSELERVVRKCLSRDPSGRYSSISELVADLAPFASEEVASLVRRLVRRDSRPAPLALAETALDGRRRPSVERTDGAAAPSTEANELTESRPGQARATFAPLQTTLPEPSNPPRNSTRMRLAAAGLAATTIAVAVLAWLKLSPAPTPLIADEGHRLSAADVASPSPPSSSANVTTEPPTSSARAEVTAPTAPTIVAGPVRVTTRAASNPSQPAVGTTDAGPTLAASPPASATGSSTHKDSRARRELDRDDP